MRTDIDRKSTRLNSSHLGISYAVFCLKKKMKRTENRSVSESLNLVPPATDADLDLNQAPDRLEIMRPWSNPNAGRLLFFFFNDTATTEIYTLSLHDALPI